MVHYSLAFILSGYCRFMEYCNCSVARGVRAPQSLLAGGPHIILSLHGYLDLGLIGQLGTWNKHWPSSSSTLFFPACAGFSLAMLHFTAACLILGLLSPLSRVFLCIPRSLVSAKTLRSQHLSSMPGTRVCSKNHVGSAWFGKPTGGEYPPLRGPKLFHSTPTSRSPANLPYMANCSTALLNLSQKGYISKSLVLGAIGFSC